jgi:aspartate/methionine/tyrosine aminotransferase
VLEAARKAIEGDRIGYTDALGIPPLRRGIAGHYRTQYGVELDPERIVVTTGSSGGFLLAFLAAFEAGDRVALAAPGYPAYRNILAALGVEPVLLETEAEHRFQPTPELLERAGGRLDGLIVASPSNPTGTMLDRAELQGLVETCAARGVRLISDEIYHGITFGREAVSAVELSAEAIVINSFSKYYSMTGWRLGWMVVPEALKRPVECLAQNLFISPPTLSQFAGAVALECRAELDAYVANYARNRALLLAELPKAGFDRLAPADGAFYLYADVSALTDDSEAFCRRMLAETGVATTPGVDFDPARGRRFLRFSFAGPEAAMAEAAERLKTWTKGL